MVIITECFSIATPAIKKAKAYSNAANLVEAGDYIEAIKIYDELNDTAKVQEYISFAIQQQVQESKKALRNSTVGQLIKVEDYEAMVIDKKQDRILIAFTRYCGSDSSRNINTVYKMSYDNSSSRWETSSIRSFLNETFLDEFPESTKNLIIETELQNHTKIGKDDGTTKDRVFILSFLDDRTYIDKLLSINGFWASPTFTRTPSGESELVCIGVENHFDGTGFHYSIESYDVKNNFYITPCAWLDIS